MKQSLYTVFDEKARKIGPVFLAFSDGEAERLVSIALAKDSLITRYPADFSLLRLGDIDITTGLVGEFDITSGLVTGRCTPVLVKKLDEIFVEVVTPVEK